MLLRAEKQHDFSPSYVKDRARSLSIQIEFRTLAAECGWNAEAQWDMFLFGLSDRIKDEIDSSELPTGVDELIALAIRVHGSIVFSGQYKDGCFHCPVCHFQTEYECQGKAHTIVHCNIFLDYKGFRIYKCHQNCRVSPHFHCPGCKDTRIRRKDFFSHLSYCPGSVSTSIPGNVSTSCPGNVSILCPGSVSALIPGNVSTSYPGSVSTSIPGNVSTSCPGNVSTSCPASVSTSIPGNVSTSCPGSVSTSIPGNVSTSWPGNVSTSCPGSISTLIPRNVSTSYPGSVSTSKPSNVSTPSPAFVKDQPGSIRCESMTQRPVRVNKLSQTLVECPHCNMSLYFKNLKRHMQRRHSSKFTDITKEYHLQSQPIDPQSGIYAVAKAFRGPPVPIHVKHSIQGPKQHIECELEECCLYSEVAGRSGHQTFRCCHLRSLDYCSVPSSYCTLEENTLNEMVAAHWFGEEKKPCV
ncbi:uncharacterized protein [Sinocyclocheilus grahami]|uniref:uncharacterized protein n=1 Tax=Sinocyclocheilus grahami TaxID=75366 RepID=UPI0007AD2317|nr:PREDICTED: uncharacterized protein LOC107565839 [Sinocyclocheilus grahami]